jgi:hypothetical protein
MDRWRREAGEVLAALIRIGDRSVECVNNDDLAMATTTLAELATTVRNAFRWHAAHPCPREEAGIQFVAIVSVYAHIEAIATDPVTPSLIGSGLSAAMGFLLTVASYHKHRMADLLISTPTRK